MKPGEGWISGPSPPPFSRAALENSRLGKDGLTLSISKRDPIQPLQDRPNRLGELPVAGVICDRRGQGCALSPPVVVAVTRVASAPWGHLWKSEPRCAQSRLWRRLLNRGSTAFSRIFGEAGFRQAQQGTRYRATRILHAAPPATVPAQAPVLRPNFADRAVHMRTPGTTLNQGVKLSLFQYARFGAIFDGVDSAPVAFHGRIRHPDMRQLFGELADQAGG